MKYLLTAFVLAFSLHARSEVFITGYTIVTSLIPFVSTTGLPADMQVYNEAKDDAAMFVATEGEVRGVYFQRALELFKKRYPDVKVSDSIVAQTIIGL
ncbi:DUF2388 domain-containing protein [Bdellovibrio sp. HCB274]|uniref:DUF2388 domain-containing protein n=1 Tax=Bdellovibrio sp. HCB274 TaxID=3394361 RepID=UPI0039B50ED8